MYDGCESNPNLCGRLGVGQILLVTEHQQGGVTQAVVAHSCVQLLFGLLDSAGVVGINDEHKRVGAIVVVMPQGTNLLLSPCGDGKGCRG
jgi:hypothetical protein